MKVLYSSVLDSLGGRNFGLYSREASLAILTRELTLQRM